MNKITDAAKAVLGGGGEQPPVVGGTGGPAEGEPTTPPADGAPGSGTPPTPTPTPTHSPEADHSAIGKAIFESDAFKAAVADQVKAHLGEQGSEAVADPAAEKARRDHLKNREKLEKAQREQAADMAEQRAKATKGAADLFAKLDKERRTNGGMPAGDVLALPGQMAVLMLDDGVTFNVDFKRQVPTTTLTVRPDHAIEMAHPAIELGDDMTEEFLVKAVTLMFEPKGSALPVSLRCVLPSPVIAGGGNRALLSENSLVFRADR